MKRSILYMAALALIFLGGRGTDIGSLRPVEVVQLTEKAGILMLETDTADQGWGLTVEQAVAKLKETTPGQIYLDTADFLLVEEGLESCLLKMDAYLKKGTRIAYVSEGVDLKSAAEYLRIHKPSATMKDGQKPMDKLSLEGGRMNLKKFQGK